MIALFVASTLALAAIAAAIVYFTQPKESDVKPTTARSERATPSSSTPTAANRDTTNDCLQNLKILAQALDAYVKENGAMPIASTWQDDLARQVGEIAELRCPSGSHLRYVYNANLSGIDPKSITNPDQVVVFYEGAGTADTGESWPEPGPHGGQTNVLLASGDAKSVASRADLETPGREQVWSPRQPPPTVYSEPPFEKPEFGDTGG